MGSGSSSATKSIHPPLLMMRGRRMAVRMPRRDSMSVFKIRRR